MQEASKTYSFKELFTHIKPAMNLTKLLSLGFGVILITWLLSQLEWEATLEILREVPLSLLVIGFLCYGISFYLRALRFRVLLPQDKPVHHLFPIVLVHYTALNIIPARLGELSYVYLLKKVNNVSTGYSVSSLIIARVFDQIALSLLFLLSTLFVDLPSQWLKTLSFTVGAFLITVFAILIIILAYKERCVDWLKKLTIRLNWNRYTIVQHTMRALDEIVIAFRNIQVKQCMEKLIGLSILIWLSIFSVNYSLLKAFHVPLSYMGIMLASTFLILLTVLPIQMLSGIGIRETTWVFIAIRLEVARNTAIVSGIGTRIVATMYVAMFALYGLWKLRNALKNIQNEETR